MLRMPSLSALSLVATVLALTGSVHAESNVDVEPPSPAELGEQKVPGEWSLAERKQWKILQDDVDQRINLVNSSCGTEMTATFDHETFRGKLLEPGKSGLNAVSFATHMADAIMAVRQICLDGAEGKAAVKAKIGRIVVRHAGKGRKHALGRKRLSLVLDPDERPRDHAHAISAFLNDNL